nr:hypothetical protein [Collinsella sp. AF38-3AC]
MHVDEFVRLCAVMDMSLACFLTKEQASDLAEHYGWARMAQVVGNFFGGSLSVGIDRYRNLGDQGDNGVYVIDGWKIVDRYATAYDEDWNAVGLRLIDPSAEQRVPGGMSDRCDLRAALLPRDASARFRVPFRLRDD